MKKQLYFVLLMSLCSCNSSDPPTEITLHYPDHFPQALPQPLRNPLTKEGVDLGRRLFFDPGLSASGKVSCATCHLPQMSFSDGQALGGSGVSGEILKRNSPALINLAWMSNLFWDGGVRNLESLPFAALTNPDEMAGDLKQIAQQLNANTSYKKAFKKAFQIDSVTSAYIGRALAQYQRTLISANAKYDRVQQGELDFIEDELKGQEVFNQKCASCHVPPLFTDNSFHNNGLDKSFPTANEDERAGRYRITLDSADLGKFKTPTLRNLKYTAPYMHDGRFSTLDDVLIYYQSGINRSPTLANDLRQLSITEEEKRLLLVFLEVLNDEGFVKRSASESPSLNK